MSGGVGVTGWLVPPRHFDPILAHQVGNAVSASFSFLWRV